jgi:hypothetical protein
LLDEVTLTVCERGAGQPIRFEYFDAGLLRMKFYALVFFHNRPESIGVLIKEKKGLREVP